MKIKQKLTDQERITFAKQIETFYEMSHARLLKIFWFALVKGIGTGFGVVLGGTIVVAIVLWLLGALSNVPFLEDITNDARETIQQGTE